MSRRNKSGTAGRKGVIVRFPRQQQGLYKKFRISESYASLLLGFIVVVISAALLISFINGKRIEENTSSASTQVSTEEIKKIMEETKNASASVTPTISPSPAPISSNVEQVVKKDIPGQYVVASNDTLWDIAEKIYGSGLRWREIAQANNIQDQYELDVGTKLTIPTAESKGGIIGQKGKEQIVSKSNKIVGERYVIKHGDTLWDIAVRAYGDGFRWSDIAKANNLMHNPNLIHGDNPLVIPRS